MSSIIVYSSNRDDNPGTTLILPELGLIGTTEDSLHCGRCFSNGKTVTLSESAPRTHKLNFHSNLISKDTAFFLNEKNVSSIYVFWVNEPSVKSSDVYNKKPPTHPLGKHSTTYPIEHSYSTISRSAAQCIRFECGYFPLRCVDGMPLFSEKIRKSVICVTSKKALSMITSNELTTKFLQYFQSKDHTVLPGSSVVPTDKTLLFTNSGMVQFKNNFSLSQSEIENLDSKCVCTVQDCIRAGGKHNDLEDVGLDSYHHTFFRMLGNWSFGSYFKERSCFFAYDFLVNVLKLDVNRLYVSIYDGTVGPDEFRDGNYSTNYPHENSQPNSGGLGENRSAIAQNKANTSPKTGESQSQSVSSENHGSKNLEVPYSTQFESIPLGEESKHGSNKLLNSAKPGIDSYSSSQTDSLAFIDTETSQIWSKYFPKDRILHFPAKENFWEMADTGPCGPCTEIHYDQRDFRELDGKYLVNKDHPDVIEIWNIVFIEYYRNADRSLTPLTVKSVDTGMGLERVVRVVNNLASNYRTDIFHKIISYIEKMVVEPVESSHYPSEMSKNPKGLVHKTVSLTHHLSGEPKTMGNSREEVISDDTTLEKKHVHISCKSRTKSALKKDGLTFSTRNGSSEQLTTVFESNSPPNTLSTVLSSHNTLSPCIHLKYSPFYTDCYEKSCPNFFKDTSYRVISDHARTLAACTFYGAKFEPTGRGYVVRRILRRAIRYCSELGIKNRMGDIVQYAGQLLNMDILTKDVVAEEIMFMKTLEKGKKLLQSILEKLEAVKSAGQPFGSKLSTLENSGAIASDKQLETSVQAKNMLLNSETSQTDDNSVIAAKSNVDLDIRQNFSQENSESLVCGRSGDFQPTTSDHFSPQESNHMPMEKVLPAQDAFTLFDTYGFPIDLTQLMCSEKGFSVDLQGFEDLLETHKRISRKNKNIEDKFDLVGYELIKDLPPTKDDFKYTQKTLQTEIVAIFQGNCLIYKSGQDNLTDVPRDNLGDVFANEGICSSFVLEADTKFNIIFKETNFYAESGGQIADTGRAIIFDSVFSIEDVQRYKEYVLHSGTFSKRLLVNIRQPNHPETFDRNTSMPKSEDQRGSDVIRSSYNPPDGSSVVVFNPTTSKATLEIDTERRQLIARNHTATHILNKVLKNLFGDDVNQCGSLVTDKKLRFDFSLKRGLTPSEIRFIESAVNEVINRRLGVQVEYEDFNTISGFNNDKNHQNTQDRRDKEVSTLVKAKSKTLSPQDGGLTEMMSKMFINTLDIPVIYMDCEKYPDKVRLIHIQTFSKELCGGTHVKNTSEIKSFKILSEQSISANVRRITACTSIEAEILAKNAETKNLELEMSYLDKLRLLEAKSAADKNMNNQHKEVLASIIKNLKTEIDRFKATQKSNVDIKNIAEKNAIKVIEDIARFLCDKRQFFYFVELPSAKTITKDLNQMATLVHKAKLQGVVLGLSDQNIYFTVRGNDCLGIANEVGKFLKDVVVGGNITCANGKGAF